MFARKPIVFTHTSLEMSNPSFKSLTARQYSLEIVNDQLAFVRRMNFRLDDYDNVGDYWTEKMCLLSIV